MAIIELHTRSYDQERQAFICVLDARLRVDATGLTVLDGDPGWQHLADTVLNHPDAPEQDLVISDDPDLWAKTLTEAFRSGDTRLNVTETPSQHAMGDVVSISPVRVPAHAS